MTGAVAAPVIPRASPPPARAPRAQRLAAAVEARAHVLLLAVRAAPLLTLAMLGWAAVRGAVPVAAAFLVGRLVAHPEAAAVSIAGFAGVVLLEQLAAPVDDFLGRLVRVRVDLVTSVRLAAAVDRAPLVSDLEGPEVRHDLTLALPRDPSRSPSYAARRLLSNSHRLVTLGCCTVVLLVLAGPTIAAVVFATVYTYRWARGRADAERAGRLRELTPLLRRLAYLRGLLFDKRAARDLVAHGAYGFVGNALADCSRREVARLEEPVPRGLRRTVAAAGALMAVASAGALIALTASFDRGDIDRGSYVFGLQAVLLVSAVAATGSPGAAYAEAKLATEATRALEARFRTVPRDAPPVPAGDARTPPSLGLSGVSYTYPHADAPALREVTLTLDAGTLVGVVGANGAGKTTLLRLLCGHYAPSAGEIRLGDAALDGALRTRWQRRSAYVPQAFQRMPGSLADNLTWGYPRRLEPALAILGDLGGAHLLRRLPGSADTSAFTGPPVELSGGEWQRVALARSLAVVDDSTGLVVWDEPTSALDTDGEALALRVLAGARRGATGVVVSHRVPLLVRCDRVLVLHEGTVCEDGTPAELLAGRTRFADLYAGQSAGYRG